MEPLQNLVEDPRSSTASLLVSFLVRIIHQLHCKRSSPFTVGLVNFNASQNFDYIPARLMQQVSTVTFVNIDLRQNNSQVQSLNTRVVIHAVTNFSWISNKISILVETLELIQNLGLYGKSKKVIILVDLRTVKLTEFEVLKQSYHHVGAIDILYVLERSGQLNIMAPALNKPSKLVARSRHDSLADLFPDRLSNLRGHPYKIACIENRPLTYRTADGRIIGIDVDFIDIIAKHQNTIAVYEYTKNPIKLFTNSYDIKYDLATYRVKHEGLGYPFKPLYFPNQFRWCIAVPKTYNRVIHEQVIWPYTPSLWTLILLFATFFVVYQLMLKQLFETHFPNAFPIVNTPLQILRIMLLFLLSEYYTAKLTAILGLSEIPIYPKSLAEFASSPIPLIVSGSNEYQYLLDNPEVHAKTIEWNFTKKYDPSGLALLQLCDLFPFTIDDTTQHLGKRHSYHHYHLIDEPISTSICLSPFRKTSPRLERFQLYVRRLNEAGIWDHLMSKWVLKDGRVSSGFKAQERKSFKSSILQLQHFIPVYVIAGYLYLIAPIIFILELVVHRLHRRFG
uniref:Ionotropic glutamate receptor L-glutamate and glycine-binding domain-containing protein n=1 Tax=Anopheles culicifacies TaxID=139723 RepID=A0A182M5I2_9DIPT